MLRAQIKRKEEGEDKKPWGKGGKQLKSEIESWEGREKGKGGGRRLMLFFFLGLLFWISVEGGGGGRGFAELAFTE